MSAGHPPGGYPPAPPNPMVSGPDEMTQRTSDVAPGSEGGGGAGPADTAGGSPARRPRRIFLLVGVVLAALLGIGLFTVATPRSAVSAQVGGAAPTFSLPAVMGTGHVGTPGSGGGNGTPAVLLFFGNWCSVCHTDIPPLAAAVRAQRAAHGPLSKIAVIGVDSYDSRAAASSFARTTGMSFPIALDSVAQVTNGLYDFTGDPETVFIQGDGTISAIKFGLLSPSRFVALERALVASR